MLQSLRDSFKKITFTLRSSILSVFAALFILTMMVLVIVYFLQITKVVKRGALLLMNKTSYSVLYDLDTQLRPAQNATQISANNIRERILDITNQTEISTYLIHLLYRLPISEGIYWADANGDFAYTVRDPAGGFQTEIINRHADPPTDIWVYLDKHGNEIKRVSNPVTFDPRTRPWFQQAVQAKTTIWTELYLYRRNMLGITVATPAFDDNNQLLGVFGMDITLEDLTKHLAEQRVGNLGEIYILDRHGNVITASLPESPTNLQLGEMRNQINTLRPWLSEAFSIYQKTGQTAFQFDFNRQTYLATFIPIPLLKDNGWMVGIIDIATDFTSKIHHVQWINIVIFLFIFVLGLALMSHVVTLIVNPIKKLVKETEKIKNFNLEEGEHITSPVREVIELANAIDNMKKGLRSFKKYVPASLVRQLIETGEDVGLGGYKQKLAIFFSDIQDFTPITEKADSNRLVKQICDYFEALSRIITRNKGTIDKYIGDSIMAFWGAPIEVSNACDEAARTAIRCMQFSQVLNMDWATKDKPLFVTHIGLHYGDAIVGSLGSSERISYTAIGDAVNIASRLVNANKVYNTFILVTDAFYKEIKEPFVLRFVDRVVLKGKAESVLIYELIAEDKQSILFDIDAYTNKFTAGFAVYQTQQWEEAIVHFSECLKIYPQDNLAPIFIERCKQFIVKPPKEWDGAWRIREK